jgi:hypothetical protein
MPGDYSPTVEPDLAMAPRETLLERARQMLRTLHYSESTEDAYLGWMRRFVRFHGRRHPRELGPVEVSAFLSNLRSYTASTGSSQRSCTARASV